MESTENTYIKENYEEVSRRVAEAAVKSNRRPSDITLVAVTKTVAPDAINSLLRLGHRDIGENKAQELLSKYDAIEADFHPNWHFIGHLQRNKVRQVIDKIRMIHSLDSYELAREIELRASAAEDSASAARTIDALIEVNIASEANKYGVAPAEAAEFAQSLAEFAHIRLRGLMCVAPDVEHSEENRIYFKKMFQLLIDMRGKLVHNESISYLSMGMTGDYVTAIEEGANIIRIGTGIFGRRKI